MCGRFTLATPAEILAEFFELAGVPDLSPRYNIAPTQPVQCVINSRDTGHRELRPLRWGLIPHWASDPTIGNRLINARAETLTEKRAFRAAFERRRCLVPADGFYEWKKEGNHKQPYYIRMADGSPFAVAGLWEHWLGPEGEVVDSCTLITTQPNDLVADVHDRMPVILPPSDYARWLNRDKHDVGPLQRLLQPYPEESMEAYAVSPHVNAPQRDDRACIKPVEEQGFLDLGEE